jgi:hypothetical protein
VTPARRKAFSAIRKGIVEHVLAGRLRATSFAVYVWLHLQADHVKGTVWTNATRLGAELGLHPVVVRRTLVGLQRDGYICSSAVPGSQQLYEITLEKYHEHFEAEQEPLQERAASTRSAEPNASLKKKEETKKRSLSGSGSSGEHEASSQPRYPAGVTRLRRGRPRMDGCRSRKVRRILHHEGQAARLLASYESHMVRLTPTRHNGRGAAGGT